MWTTPPGTALTMSVLLRPQVGLNRFGWVPLIAGLAVVRALAEVSSAEAVLKWPNDVLVASDEDDLPGWGRHRKVAGILGDLVMTQEGPVVVVGIGVNVSQSADELPVTSATSLALMTLGHGGAAPERTEVLAAVTRHLFALDSRWRDASGDAWGAGLGAEISAACATIGQVVRVEMPGGEVLDGTATGLTADGALVLRDVAGRVRSVLAGDVRHVRTAPD